MDQIPDKRAGDAERAHALDRLGRYFADGYLDIHEFEARTGKAAVARTQSELACLFVDLPDQPTTEESTLIGLGSDMESQRELDEVLSRGKKLQRIDGAVWAVVLILFFLGTFVFSVGFSWVLFPIGAFAAWGARSFLNIGNEDEKLFEELRSKEREERAERLRQAAERRHELGH